MNDTLYNPNITAGPVAVQPIEITVRTHPHRRSVISWLWHLTKAPVYITPSGLRTVISMGARPAPPAVCGPDIDMKDVNDMKMKVYDDTARRRKDRATGFAASFLLHVFCFAAGGVLLVKPIEYGVQTGSGGCEVNLVAAPLDVASQPVPPMAELKPVEKEASIQDPDPMPIFQQKAENDKPVVMNKNVQTGVGLAFKGDGSSPVPGKDATTMHSSGGAIGEAKADYFRNPPPVYPSVARQRGWEGTVMLLVRVSDKGIPENVTVDQSSGFSILDEAALKAVRKWIFSPAQLGGIALSSEVKIPIRFQLKG